MAVQILAFVIAAAITRFSVAETAFRWDTTWFYRIAEHGYLHRVPNGPTDYAGLRIAFFPGLPLVERAVHAVIGGDPVDTTFLVGAAGLVVSCLALWALVARDFDEEAAWRSVVLLAFFPGAYVFAMAYSEALAIPLAIVTLWALRRRWFLVAGLTAALAGTDAPGRTGPGGRLRRGRRPPLVGPGPNAQQHDPGRRVTRAGRRRGGRLPDLPEGRPREGSSPSPRPRGSVGTTTCRSPTRFDQVRMFGEHGLHSTPLVIVNTMGFVAVIAAVVFVAVVSLPLEYKVLAIGILGTWMFTADHGAWFRYVEAAFPVLVAVAVKVPEKRLLPVVSACGVVLGILIVLFATSTPFFP